MSDAVSSAWLSDSACCNSAHQTNGVALSLHPEVLSLSSRLASSTTGK